MGDRGNLVMRATTGTNKDDVWFYSHWGGTDLPLKLQEALAKRERWTDPSYLTRIVFCTVVKGQEGGTLSFGISTSIGDNEHDILVCDIGAQVVFTVKEDDLTEDGRLPDTDLISKIKGWTFEEFIKMDVERLTSQQ